MKSIALILFLAAVLSAAAGPQLVVAPPNGHVTLRWTYDTNLLSTNLWFNWYETTNIQTPLTNWNCMTNVVGTNLQVSLNITPGEHYFVGTTSNFWGETSITSNMCSTPPLPLPINNTATIEKAP